MEKEIYKKGFVFGAVAILALVTFIEPAICTATMKNNFAMDDVSRTFKVFVGPSNVQSTDGCKLLANLSEKDAIEIKNRLLAVEDTKNFSMEEVMDKKLAILREYNLLPSEFTVKNLKIFTDSNSGNDFDPTKLNAFLLSKNHKAKNNIDDGGMIHGRGNLGLSFYMYVEPLSRTSPFNLPILSIIPRPLWKNISRLSDIWNYPEGLDDYLRNMTIYQYLTFISVQFMFSSSANLYLNLKLVGIGDSYGFYGPFIGISAPKLAFGIYIYTTKNLTIPPPEGPYLDIELGFTVASAQLYIETTDWWSP